MRRRPTLERWGAGALLLGCAVGVAAEPGSIAGRVRLQRDGVAVDPSAVVVYVVGFVELPPVEEAEIHQRGQKFEPELLAITAGQTVSFPNEDTFFHNVFSVSPAREFDLGSYPKGSTKTRRFPSVGVVDVYCNIHPEMAATILVLPNRRFARAASDGSFRIDGVPAGRWTVYAYSRRVSAPVSAPVEVVQGQVSSASLELTEQRADFAHTNKFGEKYRDPAKYR